MQTRSYETHLLTDYFILVSKTVDGKAEIKWSGLDETNKNFYYEVEMSRNGYNFSSVGSIEKNKSADHIYKYLYSATGDDGFYFFRIKQIYSNGYTRFTGIKSIELERATLPRFSIYPNPSSGIVGIKFDDIQSGKIVVLITNAQGQSVVKKEFEVLGSSYWQIATLQRGIYWLRLTDVTSHLSCVNQLFIK